MSLTQCLEQQTFSSVLSNLYVIIYDSFNHKVKLAAGGKKFLNVSRSPNKVYFSLTSQSNQD